MHELAICQALIEQVERIARDNAAAARSGGRRGDRPAGRRRAEVAGTRLSVWAAGTVAEHAVLKFEVVPLKVRCRTCGVESEAAANRLLCGACQDWQVTVISGEEMLLQRVEIETADVAVH
jgi:hydrogenase nickel incorporation protein HypA/HybF